jgi:large subunit ribosomal protein L25
MKTITIEGQLRTEHGKSATRQLRSQDLVPGVIYGGAQEINFSAPAKAFKPLVYTPSFQYADVTVDGKTYRCILKDLQFDKVSDELIHVDLLELVEDKKVIATIPLKYVGVSEGVKAGGRMVPKMKSLKVKNYPRYLK